MAIDWKIHTYASLPSTQLYVREIAEEGFDEGMLVQALTQTKGRGRHGRIWESPMGNLYMSFLLRPDCDAMKAGQVSFVTALALSAAMDSYIGKEHKKTLKWPNDILINGKKCAGILLESELSASGTVKGLVVGIGVNIMAAPDDAVFLKQFSDDPKLAVHPFRDAVLAEFSSYYKLWQEEGFGPIRDQWLAQAHALHDKITVRVGESESKGVFEDIDENGTLLLKKDDGSIKKITAGEVFFEE